ncbi:glycosyltransferase family 39 protein [Salinisphaera sp. T31B1]|uniref:ArnT family glycosyltransferase n=1 Tax=Salinisphaera sp. T31B1 TaxID=727963 RepID=UPI00333FB1DC
MSDTAGSGLTPRVVWAFALLVVLLAAGAAGRGMNDIPLDSHEIYVAQTAENMLVSGDWLVPRLNGEYRLTKPPLSYWLVAGTARLTGHTQVGPGVARLPSLAAMIGIALLVFWLGLRLFDGPTAVVATLMCVGSLASFKYGHSARPDTLYAFWSTAILAAWVGGQQARVSRQAAWAWSLWGLFALASLTKGPQAPAILLLGVLVHALAAGQRPRLLLRQLRPLRGIALVLLVTLPWYLLLRHAIGSQTLADSQLSGQLLTIDPWRIVTPFYLLHAPILWLPWSLLLPAAVIAAWRDARGPAGLLAVTLIVAMLAFALGPQYREIYMLPWLAPAMLMLANAVMRTSRTWLALAVIVVAAAAALAWLAYQSGAAATIAILPASLLLLAAIDGLRRRQAPRAAALAAAAIALGLYQGGAVPALWSPRRYAERAFVHTLARRIDSTTPIIVWDFDPAVYSYYLDRPVTGSEALARVCDWIDRRSRDLVLVYPYKRRQELARRLDVVPMWPDARSEFQAAHLPRGTTCHETRSLD